MAGSAAHLGGRCTYDARDYIGGLCLSAQNQRVIAPKQLSRRVVQIFFDLASRNLSSTSHELQ
jgi:hypothetical protein